MHWSVTITSHSLALRLADISQLRTLDPFSHIPIRKAAYGFVLDLIFHCPACFAAPHCSWRRWLPPAACCPLCLPQLASDTSQTGRVSIPDRCPTGTTMPSSAYSSTGQQHTAVTPPPSHCLPYLGLLLTDSDCLPSAVGVCLLRGVTSHALTPHNAHAPYSCTLLPATTFQPPSPCND